MWLVAKGGALSSRAVVLSAGAARLLEERDETDWWKQPTKPQETEPEAGNDCVIKKIDVEKVPVCLTAYSFRFFRCCTVKCWLQRQRAMSWCTIDITTTGAAPTSCLATELAPGYSRREPLNERKCDRVSHASTFPWQHPDNEQSRVALWGSLTKQQSFCWM